MTNQTNLISVYKFATEKGIRPQYMYSKMREGKVPNDCYVVDARTDQAFLIKDKAEAWYDDVLNAREERAIKQSNKPVQLAGDPKMLLETVIGFMEEAGQKKLANDLKKVLVKMNQPE